MSNTALVAPTVFVFDDGLLDVHIVRGGPGRVVQVEVRAADDQKVITLYLSRAIAAQLSTELAGVLAEAQAVAS